jgi:membrane-associated protein
VTEILHAIMIPIDFILHIDAHLPTIMASYGTWVYAILFIILFAETGFVVTPFLPGDSLIFAAGALAASGSMNMLILAVVLAAAAVLGDMCNYFIGEKFGNVLIDRFEGRLIKREHITETEAFFERHGGKTILFARFVPFVRTFAPFVAGIGRMHYGKFARFNVTGGLLWTWGFLALGYFFGNIPFVKDNFEWVILGIIAISLLPAVIKAVQSRIKKGSASTDE